MAKTFTIHALSKFRGRNPILLSITSLLHVQSPELSHPVTESSYPLAHGCPLSSSPSPCTVLPSTVLPVSVSLLFRVPHVMLVSLCLAWSTWRTDFGARPRCHGRREFLPVRGRVIFIPPRICSDSGSIRPSMDVSVMVGCRE